MVSDFYSKYLTKNLLVRLLVRSFFKATEKMLAGLKLNRALEIGCGFGFSTQYLSKFLRPGCFEASELDINLLSEARERNPGVKISQESVYQLKREAESFDLVIALEVLEHLEEPELALRELQRVSSKYCLLSVPREPLWRILNISRLKYLSEFGNTPGHLQHWSKKQFTKLVKNYFNVQKIKSPLPWLIILGKKYDPSSST